MKFYTKRALPPSVPIVPMIDILTILLLFFVVNTQWKKPRHLLSIEIPSVQNITGVKEVRQRATIFVASDSAIDFDGQKVDIAHLAETLVAFKKVHPETQLELEADRQLPVEKLVKVWDEFTAAGINIKDIPTRIEVASSTEPSQNK